VVEGGCQQADEDCDEAITSLRAQTRAKGSSQAHKLNACRTESMLTAWMAHQLRAVTVLVMRSGRRASNSTSCTVMERVVLLSRRHGVLRSCTCAARHAAKAATLKAPVLQLQSTPHA
jgi:hypothetical protein